MIRSGKNYGWPVVTYNVDFGCVPIVPEDFTGDLEEPCFFWTPSLAASGMAFVKDDKYEGWEGSLIIGSTQYNYLLRLDLNGDDIVQRSTIANKVGEVKDIEMGNDGYLYIAVEGKGLYRLLPN